MAQPVIRNSGASEKLNQTAEQVKSDKPSILARLARWFSLQESPITITIKRQAQPQPCRCSTLTASSRTTTYVQTSSIDATTVASSTIISTVEPDTQTM